MCVVISRHNRSMLLIDLCAVISKFMRIFISRFMRNICFAISRFQRNTCVAIYRSTRNM
jgi:hypothetical protein